MVTEIDPTTVKAPDTIATETPDMITISFEEDLEPENTVPKITKGDVQNLTITRSFDQNPEMDTEDPKTATTTLVTDTTEEITMINVHGGTIADQEETEDTQEIGMEVHP